MATTIRDASWDSIQSLRIDVEARIRAAPSVASAAQAFVETFCRMFETVVLSRVFVVAPLRSLPVEEQRIARAFAASLGRAETLDEGTPVLTLIGTSGLVPEWNKRETSSGHRAIPLVDREFVDGAPMIAALLGSMKIDFAHLQSAKGIGVRHLAGGLNARFYVEDARTGVDDKGRHIIAAQDFVHVHGIRTVFGMGGAYVGGSLVAAIMFTREKLAELYIDRFPSFIGTFKMATSTLMERGHLLLPATAP